MSIGWWWGLQDLSYIKIKASPLVRRVSPLRKRSCSKIRDKLEIEVEEYTWEGVGKNPKLFLGGVRWTLGSFSLSVQLTKHWNKESNPTQLLYNSQPFIRKSRLMMLDPNFIPSIARRIGGPFLIVNIHQSKRQRAVKNSLVLFYFSFDTKLPASSNRGM